MTNTGRNPILYFITGFLLGIFIFAAILFLWGFMTFNLAGGETLGQIERQNLIFMIVAAVPAIWCAFWARHYWIAGRRPKAFARGASALTILIGISVFFFWNVIPHRSFDKDTWTKTSRKPLAMAAALVEDRKLIGLNGKQVEQMLGKPNENNENPNAVRGAVSYLVEDEWKMTIYFENDKVVDAVLRQPYLGI